MNRSNLLPRVRRTLWMAIAILCVTPALVATQPKNQKKGFNANDVYQFNGVDSINTFNGNLTLTIPIGSSYSVGGGLSYGLTLVSNANVWESVQHCHAVSVGCQWWSAPALAVASFRVSSSCPRTCSLTAGPMRASAGP